MPITSQLFTDGKERPALVLVHGLGSAGTIWKSLTPALLNHFKVITVDLPGHGSAPIHPDEKVDPKSLAQAIFEEVSKEHEIDQCHVAGNSLGGWIALEMGALGPNKVKSVTALAPAGLWRTVTKKRFPPSLDARVLAKISQYFMKTAFRIAPLKALGYKKITHLWRELSFESCRDSVIAMARATGYKPLWKGLQNQRFNSAIDPGVEVAIVFGDADRTLPEDIAQDKSIAPPHSEWITVENCAHVIMWNYPDLTVELIKQTAEKAEIR